MDCFRAVQARFSIHVGRSVRENAYTCEALIVCGTRVMELSFVLNVTTRVGVGKAAAMAAAAAARNRAGTLPHCDSTLEGALLCTWHYHLVIVKNSRHTVCSCLYAASCFAAGFALVILIVASTLRLSTRMLCWSVLGRIGAPWC
jgi:hypothetical protein